MQDVLDLETRRDIYNLIEKNPGLHLSKIADLLSMRTSHVEYHLLFLEKNDLIKSEKEQGYKRFFIKGQVGVKDKRYFTLLRQKTVLHIILVLLKHQGLKHKELLTEIDVSGSTLSYHLNKLVKHDLLSVRRYGDEKGYYVNNPDEVITFLIKYKPYSVIDGFTDLWKDLNLKFFL
jgi:predicted transcriptional regulator